MSQKCRHADHASRLLSLLGLAAMNSGGRLEIPLAHPDEPAVEVKISFNPDTKALVVHAQHVKPLITH